MSDHLFTWAVGGSIGTHVVALSVMAALGFWTATAAPPDPVPIEILPATPEAPPPPPPRVEPVKAPKRFIAPRATAPAPAPAPIQPSMLIDDKTALETPAPASNTPEPQRLPANAMISNPNAAIPGLREGGAAGAGSLFSTGDMPVQAGRGTSGGSGASGRAGSGLASTGTADAAAAAGVTSFAKPLGGYQTLPRYPESARRAGIEGVTTLRFLVLANGHVGTIHVEHSAGHMDLDRAAIDAVKTWLFEPARRGKEPVPVWVTLPVRFGLTSH